jgi:hypothetical protein
LRNPGGGGSGSPPGSLPEVRELAPQRLRPAGRPAPRLLGRGRGRRGARRPRLDAGNMLWRRVKSATTRVVRVGWLRRKSTVIVAPLAVGGSSYPASLASQSSASFAARSPVERGERSHNRQRARSLSLGLGLGNWGTLSVTSLFCGLPPRPETGDPLFFGLSRRWPPVGARPHPALVRVRCGR